MGKEDITVTVYPIYHKDLANKAISNMMMVSKRCSIMMKSRHNLTRFKKHGTLTFYFDNIQDRDSHISMVMNLCIWTSQELKIPPMLEKKPDPSPGTNETFNIYVHNIPSKTRNADVRQLFDGPLSCYCSGGKRTMTATLMFVKNSCVEKCNKQQTPFILRGNTLKLYFENTNNIVYADVDSHVADGDFEVSRRTMVVDNIPAGTSEMQLEEFFAGTLFVEFHKNIDGSRNGSASLHFAKEINVYNYMPSAFTLPKFGENMLAVRHPNETKDEHQCKSENVILPTLVVDNIPPGTTEMHIKEAFRDPYFTKFHKNAEGSNTGSASVCFLKETDVIRYIQHKPMKFGDNILLMRRPERPEDEVQTINRKDFLISLINRNADEVNDRRQGGKQRTDQRSNMAVSRTTQQNRMPMVQRRRQPNAPFRSSGNRPPNKDPLNKGSMHPGPRSILKGSTSTRNDPPVKGKTPPEKTQEDSGSFLQDRRPPNMGGIVPGSSGIPLPDGKLMAGCKRSSMGDNRSINVNEVMQENRPLPRNHESNIPLLMSDTVAPVGDMTSGSRAQTDVPTMTGNQAHTTGINSGDMMFGNESSQQPDTMEMQSIPMHSDGAMQVFDYGHTSQVKDEFSSADKISKDAENNDSSMNQSTNWDPENM